MPQPRNRQVSLQDTPYYYCITRCVRRAFLCGKDSHTGFDFEHRRQWIADRIRLLCSVWRPRQADPDTLFFQRRIRIEGDTELGLGVKNTMDSMDWEDLRLPLRRLLQAISLVIEKLRGKGLKE